MPNIPLNPPVDAFSAEPDILILFQTFPKRAQHQFLQLAIEELELDGAAEQSADAFLASSAWQIEDGDADRTSELYPQGCSHRQTWLRHKLACADEITRLERLAQGRAAMRMPRIRMAAPLSFE